MRGAHVPRADLLRALVAPEWRAHPWRQVLAVLAVALGVALAWSVHLINQSALAEFAGAVRSIQGEPDASFACAQRDGCDDALADTLAARPDVRLVVPVLDLDTYALSAAGRRVALRLVGTDALSAATLAPSLRPLPADGQGRTAALDPEALFLNPAAQDRLGVVPGDTLRVQHGSATVTLRVAGRVAAGGPPLAVLDVAGAQHHFGMTGRLSRLDLRLAPGVDAASLADPPGWRAVRADDASQRVSNVSRAYRVNLTVLALVALFVGAFLVFAVMALSVAQRVPSLALLGVLGLSARERGALVRAECLLLGSVGSTLGIGAGTVMAQAALTWLAGDLGGGYFPGVAPALRFDATQALLFALLGVAAALIGGWLPARQAQALAPAQALKGLGGLTRGAARRRWPGPALLAAGALLALAPPVAGLPVAAYLSVALLLVGGIACVPLLVDALLARLPASDSVLPLLALRRAHHERDAAAVAVAGVVASLALSVALTVMVASFRDGVARWLDQVLPADLYLRSATSGSAADQAFLPADLPQRAAALPGVARVEAARVRALTWAPDRPAVTLFARPLADPAQSLPLLGTLVPADPQRPAVYVSEAMVSLYGAGPGSTLRLPLGTGSLEVQVRGVWRDYARQFGSIVIDATDYRRATADTRQNDLALWLTPGASADDVQRALRDLLGADAALYDTASAAQLRTLSLAIFDRSFAVTRYLQVVAVAIGLAGIAASFSAQVWARRREFGLLAHLGFTRAQVIGLVAGEGAAWTAAGAIAGLGLGLAVAVVLVHVVNPQSFHWTMELLLPWGRLLALAAGVLVAGTLTAALSARAVAGRRLGDMVAAVKEDW